MSRSGSASKQARGSARDKVTQLRKEQTRRERRRSVAIWSATATAIVLVAGIVTFSIVREQRNKPSLDQVATYAQTPPAGEHAPTWMNCATYDKPVPNENEVHSLEHGAVWITYRSDLPAAQVAQLRKAMPDTYAVLSLFEGLKAPVVASAWGRQLPLTGVDDPRLGESIREFRQGTQAPEPGAACSGGTDGTSAAPDTGS